MWGKLIEMIARWLGRDRRARSLDMAAKAEGMAYDAMEHLHAHRREVLRLQGEVDQCRQQTREVIATLQEVRREEELCRRRCARLRQRIRELEDRLARHEDRCR